MDCSWRARVEAKVAAISANKAQGPGGSTGSRLKARLSTRGLRLPALECDDETADREYVRLFCLLSDRELGEAYGVEYAEPFYYFGPESTAELDDYIAKNAVRI